ncbi:MAG: lipocalin family protein [Candidatus Accumulibacter sp.]|nr:lipocalin family protein [Accumulibacter sp.]
MENPKAFYALKTKLTKTAGGAITVIKGAHGLSQHGAIGHNGKTVLANYVYQKDETYDVVYTVIKADGEVEGNFQEYIGVLPTLFRSPDNEIFASITDTRTEKEQDLSLPLLNREAFDEPKHKRPYPGKYIGNVNQSAIFHNVDIFSDKKPDTLLSLSFDKGKIKKHTLVKLDFPKDNKIYISDNKIHLIGKDAGAHIHRQIDENGNEIQKRKLELGDFWCREALKLSFEGRSTLISNRGSQISLLEIDEKGKLGIKTLIDIKDKLYNTWRPVEISDDVSIIQFNTEYGNGWLAIRGNELVEAWYGRDDKGYESLLSKETIEIENNDLIINGINGTEENSYSVVLQPNTREPKEIIVLNRTIGNVQGTTTQRAED